MAATIVAGDQDLRVRYDSERDPFYQLVREIWYVEQYTVKRTQVRPGVNGRPEVTQEGVWELRSEHHNLYDDEGNLTMSGLKSALEHTFMIAFRESDDSSATVGIHDIVSVDIVKLIPRLVRTSSKPSSSSCSRNPSLATRLLRSARGA